MKNKKAPLNFTNVCNIRAYLAIAVQDAVKSRRESVKYWGASSGMTKLQGNRVREIISAYRATQNIQITY
jgi:hypothetical protein